MNCLTRRAQVKLHGLAVVMGFALSGVGLSAAEPDLGDYMGCWEIWIEKAGDSFASAWLEVRQDDGKPAGSLLWKWGSVLPAAVELDAGELVVTRDEDGTPVRYRARLDQKGELVGSVKTKEGAEFQFTGRRAVETIDPSGTWDFQAAGGNWRMERQMELSCVGGELTGSWTARDGSTIPLRELALAGDTLTFSAERPSRDGQRQWIVRYSGTVKGDQIDGTLKVEGRDVTREWTATRRRTWAEPVVLFDGKSLAGWHPRDTSRKFAWHVTPEGTMRNTPPDVDVVSDAKFGDFKLHLEFKLAPGSNSGVYLRGRYEVQVLDDHGKGISPHGNGAVYSRIPASQNASKPAGEWQAFDITLVGQWLTVVLNGTTIIDHQHLDGITGGALDPWQAEPGPLMLQGDHGLVEYRNVTVTPAG